MHRKKAELPMNDKYRTINYINLTLKQKCLKTPKVVGIIRLLLSAYLLCINSYQSTSMTKTF